MTEKIELIKHAAVMTDDGRIFMAKNHGDCFHKAHELGVKLSSKADAQGFVTNINGRFLTRLQAANLAFFNNQIEKKTPMLFSEDLWCPTYNGKHDYDDIKGYILRK